MRMPFEQILVAALVAKLGGEVLVTREDLFEAEEMELLRWQDFPSGGDRFRVQSAAILDGELMEDLPEIEVG